MEQYLASISIEKLIIPLITAIASAFIAYQAFKSKATTEIEKLIQLSQFRSQDIEKIKKDLNGLGIKENATIERLIKVETIVEGCDKDKDNMYSKLNDLDKRLSEIKVKLEYINGKK